jgi:hypothetical protein
LPTAGGAKAEKTARKLEACRGDEVRKTEENL